MNSLLLISPYKGSGFNPILSGNAGNLMFFLPRINADEPRLFLILHSSTCGGR